MTSEAETNLLRILRAAQDSEHGLLLTIIADPQMIAPASRAKQILYKAKSLSPDFSGLQIVFSPKNPDTELWIIKTQEPECP